MKKFLAILLAAMMLLSLAACGENNTTDPDKDNPGVSQSDDKGGGESTNSGGNTDNGNAPSNEKEWPDDKFTTHVPEPTFASYVSCSEQSAADGYILGQYGFSLEDEVNMDDVRAYAAALQSAGFTENVTTTDTSINYYFAAYNPTTRVSVTLTIYPDSNPVMRTLQIYIPG